MHPLLAVQQLHEVKDHFLIQRHVEVGIDTDFDQVHFANYLHLLDVMGRHVVARHRKDSCIVVYENWLELLPRRRKRHPHRIFHRSEDLCSFHVCQQAAENRFMNLRLLHDLVWLRLLFVVDSQHVAADDYFSVVTRIFSGVSIGQSRHQVEKIQLRVFLFLELHRQLQAVVAGYAKVSRII